MSVANKPWFPAKIYGIGWGLPTCWHGWAVLLVYFALLGAGLLAFRDARSTPYFVVYVAAVSLGLTAVCWWKGEPPQWRWGKK